MNEDCCEALKEHRCTKKYCTKSDVMIALSDLEAINQQPQSKLL